MKFKDLSINEADVEEYRERGYWVSPKLLTNEQIARLRTALGRIFDGDYDGEVYPYPGFPLHLSREQKYDPDSTTVRKMNNAGWINNDVRATVTSPLLGSIASQLMGCDAVRLWHDQVIWKPGVGSDTTRPAEGNNIGWHQDYGYWQCCSTTNMCTAWIALQDTDLSNGGIRTIVYSHKWGLVDDARQGFFEQDLNKLRDSFVTAKREWIDEPCVLKAGQASFHHALAFHGSGRNQTEQPRLAVVAHLMPAETYYRGRVQYHPAIPLLGPNAGEGTPFEGECFPKIWPQQM